MERKYEDFEVHTEWVHEATLDTLIAYLPGFRKEQIKVQITSTGNLRIYGERSIGDNIFGRFHKEIPILSNCDQNNVRATFGGGMLHVNFPKLTVQAKPEQVGEEAKLPAKVPKSEPDQKADADHVSPPEKQKNQQTPPPPSPAPTPAPAPTPIPPQATMEKQANEKKDEVEEKKPEKEKEMKDDKNAADEADENAMKKEEKGTTSEKLEHGDSDQDSAAAGKAKLEPEEYQPGIDYKQALEGLIKDLKNPRKIMNMFLAVLVALVLGVYVRNAIKFLTNYLD